MDGWGLDSPETQKRDTELIHQKLPSVRFPTRQDLGNAFPKLLALQLWESPPCWTRGGPQNLQELFQTHKRYLSGWKGGGNIWSWGLKAESHFAFSVLVIGVTCFDQSKSRRDLNAIFVFGHGHLKTCTQVPPAFFEKVVPSKNPLFGGNFTLKSKEISPWDIHMWFP